MNIFRILVQLISTSFGLVYILALSAWKFSRRTTFISAAVFIAVTTATNFFVVSKLSYIMEYYPIYDFLYRAGNTCLVLVTARLLVKQQEAQRVFAALTAGLCVFIVDTFAIIIRIWFQTYPLELMFEFLAYPAMTLLILRIRKPFLEVMAYLKNRLWPLCVISSFLLVCLFTRISIPLPLEYAPENIPSALMICGVCAAVYGVLIFLFKTLLVQTKLEHNVDMMKLYASSLEHQNNIAVQNIKNNSLFRHDLRHINQMILACLDNEDIDGARNLLRDTDATMREPANAAVTGKLTGHKLMDSVLGYYIGLSRDSGIDVALQMELMDEVDVDKTELAVVLSNALENAVRACMKLPDEAQRAIRLNGHWCGEQFFMEIANTCTGEVGFDPETGLPVSEKSGHGLGSQSISFFARKHSAVLQYQLEDRWFYLRLLL